MVRKFQQQAGRRSAAAQALHQKPMSVNYDQCFAMIDSSGAPSDFPVVVEYRTRTRLRARGAGDAALACGASVLVLVDDALAPLSQRHSSVRATTAKATKSGSMALGIPPIRLLHTCVLSSTHYNTKYSTFCGSYIRITS